MKSLFTQHILRIQGVVQQALELAQLEGLWIYAGQPKSHFLDDQTAPFKINPHFNWIFPDPTAEQSWLYLDGKNKPKIYFYAPQDYWNVVPHPPVDQFFADAFDWHILSQADEIRPFFTHLAHCAFIGESDTLAQTWGFQRINPKKVLNVLHFARSIKSEFEIACIRTAQDSAVAGHLAAKHAFFEGKSEFDINLAYLTASGQSELNVPYGNIVAINQHAAILHYTRLDRRSPDVRHSFLLDAGATHLGYAADITRTYAFDPQSEWAALIQQMTHYKHAIIADLHVGVNYLHYHTQMQRWIAEMLQQYDFVHLPAEQIFEEGISRAFFPHGLGHQLGLQVHDVAGFQQNPRGTHKAPPSCYPSLRCTRDLQAGMVLTIEPGFYFIEMLLNEWKHSPLARFFNWQKIEQYKALGGIRTEDNVVIRPHGAENLTPAF